MDQNGIGICKFKSQFNEWKYCCPIGHVPIGGDKCFSLLGYTLGPLMKGSHQMIPIFIGKWKQQDKNSILHFLANVQDSDWYKVIQAYINFEFLFRKPSFQLEQEHVYDFLPVSKNHTLFSTKDIHETIVSFENDSITSSHGQKLYIVLVRFIKIIMIILY